MSGYYEYPIEVGCTDCGDPMTFEEPPFEWHDDHFGEVLVSKIIEGEATLKCGCTAPEPVEERYAAQ